MKENRTLSVSVLSGKGGVGKTNIALNLGYCLYKGGHSLLLMDCDLGLANLDVLLGISPETNLQDVLDTRPGPAARWPCPWPRAASISCPRPRACPRWWTWMTRCACCS